MNPKKADSANLSHQTVVEVDRLYQTAPVGLCLMDRELRFVHVNERMASFNGCSVDAHTGKTLMDIVPRIAERVEPLYRQVIDTEQPVLNVQIASAPDPDTGRVKHWLSHFYPAQDDSGEIIGVSTVVLETTELERARETIEARLQIEALVAEVSAGFLILPAADIDAEIERRLSQFGELLGFERASLMETCDTEVCMEVTHAWAARGVPRPPTQIPLDQIPWTFSRLLDEEVVSLSNLDELPARAAQDRDFYQKLGLRSVVAIPLAIAGARLGVLSFVSLTRERECTEALLPRLRLVGEIFASALIRMRAEKALGESESRYRRIIENQEEFIVRWTPDTRTTFVNDAYCRAFGQSREQLLGTSFLSLIPEDSRQGVIQKLKRLTLNNPTETDEHKVLRPDGTTGRYLWADRGIFDDNGRLIEVQSVGRDITERRLAEEALRVSEQRYRTLVENAPEAIVVFDIDAGRFVDVNENAVRLFKMDRERLLRVSPVDLSPPKQPNGTSAEKGIREWLIKALAGETPRFEWIHRDAEGRNVPCEVRLVRLPSTGGEQLVRGSLTDITERKRMEQELHQAQKMEAVGRLAGGIAHDFNNLLTAIQGNAELGLARVGPDGPTESELNEILAASERAAALTRQLLAFSRKQKIQSHVLSLNKLVANLNNMLHRVIGEDVRLSTKLSASRHHVDVDPGQLEQVIVNLAVNARDAMPKGGALTIATSDLTIETSRMEGDQLMAPGHYVVLEVSDSGTGIPAEAQSRIFEPFFTTKERGKGTGLGLSTAYGFVTQSQGSIRVESELGHGTTFKVCLPSTDERPDHGDRLQVRATRGTETILLVEDEDIVRNLACRGLKKYGYSVLEAADGAEALRISEDHEGPIDLLVTDVIMPGMSGVDLAERLCRLREDIDILYVSGYTDDLIKGHGVLGDQTEILEKPFTPVELARKVRELIDRTGPSF